MAVPLAAFGRVMWEVGGASDSAQQFGRVTDVARMASGEVVVLDAFGPTLHVVDAEGRVIRSFGRRGEGPGELTAPVRLAAAGDSIFVFDVGTWRVTAFDRGGRVLGEVAVAPRRQSGWPTEVHRADDGAWLYLDQEIESPTDPSVVVEDGIIRATATVLRLLPGSGGWTEGPAVRGAEAAIQADETGPALTTAPFPASPLWAPAGAAAIWYGDSRTYVLWKVGFRGDTVAIIDQRTILGDPITEDDRLDFLLGPGRRWPESDPRAQRRRALPFPSHKPVLTTLRGTRDRLRVEVLHGGARTWHEYDADGAPLRRISFPDGFVPAWIGGDTAIGTLRDSLDVQSVVRLTVGS